MSAAGPSVLIVVAAAFLAPWLIERAGHEDPEHDHSSTKGLELSYWGLALHKLGDGFALGAFTGEAHAGHHHRRHADRDRRALGARDSADHACLHLGTRAQSGIRRAAGLALIGALGVASWRSKHRSAIGPGVKRGSKPR